MSFIKNLQEKPHHVRVKIFISVMALAVMVGIGILIFMIKHDVSQKEDQVKNSMPTIFESLKATAEDVFSTKEVKIK